MMGNNAAYKWQDWHVLMIALQGFLAARGSSVLIDAGGFTVYWNSPEVRRGSGLLPGGTVQVGDIVIGECWQQIAGSETERQIILGLSSMSHCVQLSRDQAVLLVEELQSYLTRTDPTGGY